MTASLHIHDAHAHNLRHLDLVLRHDRLTVLTGVSGSGKSSLAFDVVFQEGQRRFLETLAPMARLQLGKLDPPAVGRVDGLRPAVSLAQDGWSTNPRSTVASLTGLGVLVRLLWSRLGVQHCPACGAQAVVTSADGLLSTLRARFGPRFVRVLAPLVEGHRGARRELLAAAAERGLREVWIDGAVHGLVPVPALESTSLHTVALVTGALGPASDAAALERAVRLALDLGHGVLGILPAESTTWERFDVRRACPGCGQGLAELGPRLFSANAPQGACPQCQGLGVEDHIDPGLLVADPRLSLRQGALVPTQPNGYIMYSQVTPQVLESVCQAHGFDLDTPWQDLSAEQQAVVFHGTDRVVVPFGKHPLESRLKWKGITARPREEGHYKGIITTLEGILRQGRNPGVLRFVRSGPCQACHGTRLNPAARAVRLRGQALPWLTAQPLSQALDWLQDLTLTAAEHPVAAPLLAELGARGRRLRDLALDHLSLDRPSPTLSGGELRRVLLANRLAGDLCSLMYVLDEPTAGLHPRDRARLVELLRRLRDQGNTLLVVEHDPVVMRAADDVVDLGPGAGVHGGDLLFAGPWVDWARQAGDSPTVLALGRTPGAGLTRPNRGCLVLHKPALHNLKAAAAVFQVGALNAVTGVSGAGKSSLVSGLLGPALARRLGQPCAPDLACGSLEGGDGLCRVVAVDASPIGKNPRSNPATYTKVFARIRALFAGLPAARERGFSASHFSFNRPGGRCEACEGAGSVVLGLHFLPDLHQCCPVCEGRRFQAEALAVSFRDHDIHQVLSLSVDEALALFAGEPVIREVLQGLSDLGLGYLPLGQPSTTLSGGEARRVKLAAELARTQRQPTLYLLDEPSVGLHAADLDRLLAGLQRLVEQGHTVVVVDHNLQLVEAADHVLDLGPGSGPAGGQVVVAGTPAQVAACPQSATGQALRARWDGVVPQAAPDADAQPVGDGSTRPAPIHLEGVHTHNLRGVSVQIPRERFTVITGVSGSGKSSLAFDTLHAEAQRRFATTLPARARRFLTRLPAPPMDRATGLTPSVAVRQRDLSTHPGSTVATASGIHPLLRLLWARAGTGEARFPAQAFSFNHSLGACHVCEGRGQVERADPQRLITHPALSLWQGAMGGHKPGQYLGEPDGRPLAVLAAVADGLGLDLRRPFNALGEEERAVALHGTQAREWTVDWHYRRGKRAGVHRLKTRWPGLLGLVEEEWSQRRGSSRGRDWHALLQLAPCPACLGQRLQPGPAAVRLAGLRLGDVLARPLMAFKQLLSGWLGAPAQHGLVARQQAVLASVAPEIQRRLATLLALGLGHLGLDRATASLSSGEARRLQIAGHLAAPLGGLTLVLDEPSAGLHPRDVQGLLAVLRALVVAGNTVVAVEHQPAFLAAADHLLELGPGAGRSGGHLLYSGAPAGLSQSTDSPSGAWLRGARRLPRRLASRPAGPPVVIEGATLHNLRGLDVALPTRCLVGISGVSGSGKSTLLHGVLGASARTGRPVSCRVLLGLQVFTSVQQVDRTPLGPNPASTLATFLGLLDPLRRLFAASSQARAAHLGPAAFAYLSPQGRCPACNGLGQVHTAMDFLADVWVPCTACAGARYRPEVLQVRLRGHDMGQVLQLTVNEVAALFADRPELTSPLQTLGRLGLGYLPLGQPAPTLSGGESQRLRLAAGLLRGQRAGAHLFLLDEPTQGLHLDDVARLLDVLDALLEQGHSVVVTSHHLGLLGCCDHIIDLGPEGGDGGGEVVFTGAPEGLRGCRGSATGRALAGEAHSPDPPGHAEGPHAR